MTDKNHGLLQLHSDLGYKQLNRTWAKIETLLGLCAAGLGMFLGNWALSRPVVDTEWSCAVGGFILFVLGGYLALAGNRSHLYQSNNELTAFLFQEIRRLKDKG